MDFSYSEEQQLLQDSVARFVREHYDFETRRGLVSSGAAYSSENWKLFAELGWLAIPVAEADEGLGGSLIDCAILFEQFGKGLVLEPYLATVILGAGIVSELGDAAQRAAILPAVMAGELQLALGFAEPGSRYELERIATSARRDGAEWVLSGSKSVVLNAPAAGILLISAIDDQQQAGIFCVPADAPGLRIERYPTVDGSHAAEVHLESVRVAAGARLVGSDALAALGRVIDRATLCVCAEAVGAMSVLLARTVEYCKTRKQFGVALSSFQALQHRMTEMFIELEQSRSILVMALMSADNDEDCRRAVSAAKSRIGRAARLVGQEAIQLHGGIGVTEELDVGHFFKRLTAIEAVFGNSDWHLRRFAALDG